MYYGWVFDMSVVSDNEIVFTGLETGNNYYDVICAAKLDSSGNVIWSKGFYQSDGRSSTGRNIVHTNDNKILIGGYIGLYNSVVFQRPVLIKLDLNGDIQWMNYYLLNDNIFAYESPSWFKSSCIQYSVDSSYVFAGNYADPQRWNPFLLKVNSENGHTVWGRNYEVSYNAVVNNLFELNKKLYLIGNTSADLIYDSKPYLLISDSAGMPLTQGTYGKFNNSIESAKLIDDSIYMVGSSLNYYGAPYSLTNSDVYFSNMNQDGETVSLIDSLYDTKSFDFDVVSANSDFYSMELNLIKESTSFQQENINTILDSNVCAPLAIFNYNVIQGISIFPNPAKDLINIRIPSNATLLRFYNNQGQLLFEKTGNGNNFNIDISGLINGLYIISAIVGSNIFTGKFIKE